MYLRQIQIAVRDQSTFDSFLSSELLIPDITSRVLGGVLIFKESIVKCADEITVHITDTTQHGGGVDLRGLSADIDPITGEIFVDKIFFSMISVDEIIACLSQDVVAANGLAKNKFGFQVNTVQRSVQGSPVPQQMASIKFPILNNRLSIVLQFVPSLLIPAWLRFIRFGTSTFSEFSTISETTILEADADQEDHKALDIFFDPLQIGMIGQALPNFTIDIRFFKPSI